jgi:hypothetical protein
MLPQKFAEHYENIALWFCKPLSIFPSERQQTKKVDINNKLKKQTLFCKQTQQQLIIYSYLTFLMTVHDGTYKRKVKGDNQWHDLKANCFV